MKMLFNYLTNQHKKVWFVTFENKALLQKINEHPENLFKFTERPKNPLYETQKETFYILIDEVQYAADPSHLLKYLYDVFNPHIKIIATCSSSFYLDSKFKDSLSGRKRIFTLRTLNFEELLQFKKQHHLLDELYKIRTMPEYISLNYKEIIEQFEEYLIFGGYPEVVLSENKNEKIELLGEIKNSYLRRDVFESKVENEEGFYQLMYLLALQTGNLLNKFELSKSLKIHVFIRLVELYGEEAIKFWRTADQNRWILW